MNDSDAKLREATLQSVKRGACKAVDDLLAPIGTDARAKMIADEFGVDEHSLLPQMGAAFVEQEMARLRQMVREQMIMPIEMTITLEDE